MLKSLREYLFTDITDYCVMCGKRKTHHDANNCELVKVYEKLCEVEGINCDTCKHKKLFTIKDQLCCHSCPLYQFWEEDK